ncbi:Aste57867_9926 [Aphanomyces stellatus]|uniref:Aste57867_9926 protein n=1 Tax=Aphanomyces stellatus TaxID=120398 RepID=A0A485KP36_9STRA|nr:hypothetical protein As57867_009887 [Aphanomyces stellatus]VFT86804.1 Aste57867_9926 [Aphanomyces stellatus]
MLADVQYTIAIEPFYPTYRRIDFLALLSSYLVAKSSFPTLPAKAPMAAQDQLIDLEERLSYRRSTNGKNDTGDCAYAAAKSPVELEDGALVEGGAIPLISREAFGLYSQYGAIGIIYGMLPALKYPIFNAYLALEPYQVSTYGTLVVLGWSYKVFFGMLSDCFPIMGYRRKSWMLVGWTITMICLCVMAFSDLGEPYCNREKTDSCGTPIAKVNKTDFAANYNPLAPDQGTKFIMLSVLVSFGYVTAACASDAMVVEYAQREPMAIRGRIQTAIYTVRYLGGIIAVCVTAFGLNGKRYNGSFSFSMSPNVPYGIMLIPCVLVVLSTVFVVVEEKHQGARFRVWWGSFWELLQKRVMWQICAFRFFSNVFQYIGTTADNGIQTYWAKVEPLNDSLQSLAGKAIFAVILTAVGKWGLHWNWRWVIALGSIGVIVIDSFVNFMTIWDVVRNQWFYTGVMLADSIPDGVRFIVGSYVAVEIADLGNEGATYGLITTLNNLASPFALVIYKYINSYFMLSGNDFKKDTTEVRWDVTYAYLISYSCKLLALGWLVLLPPQREPLQELKKKGGTSKLAAYILVISFFSCLAFSMVSNFMSIYPSTKCYRIAGGNGVVDPVTGKCPITKK